MGRSSLYQEASAGDRVHATVQGFFQDPKGRAKERRTSPQPLQRRHKNETA
jgi:hypothetical protein